MAAGAVHLYSKCSSPGLVITFFAKGPFIETSHLSARSPSYDDSDPPDLKMIGGVLPAAMIDQILQMRR